MVISGAIVVTTDGLDATDTDEGAEGPVLSSVDGSTLGSDDDSVINCV